MRELYFDTINNCFVEQINENDDDWDDSPDLTFNGSRFFKLLTFKMELTLQEMRGGVELETAFRILFHKNLEDQGCQPVPEAHQVQAELEAQHYFKIKLDYKLNEQTLFSNVGFPSFNIFNLITDRTKYEYPNELIEFDIALERERNTPLNERFIPWLDPGELPQLTSFRIMYSLLLQKKGFNLLDRTHQLISHYDVLRMLHSTLYDYHEIVLSNNYPIDLITLSSCMFTNLFKIKFTITNTLSRIAIEKLISPPANATPLFNTTFLKRYLANEEPGKICFVFNAAEDKIFEIISHIFNKLKTINSLTAQSTNYSDLENKVMTIAAQYCWDRSQQFPGGNYYLRKWLPQKHPREKWKEINSGAPIPKLTLELDAAISDRNLLDVKKLIKKGASVSAQYNGGLNVIANSFYPAIHLTEDTAEIWLKIFGLLIEIGAPVAGWGSNHHSLLATLIAKAIDTKEALSLSVYRRMIQMTLFQDNGRTVSIITEAAKKQTCVAYWIEEGQERLAQLKRIPRGMLFSTHLDKITYVVHDKKFQVPNLIHYVIDNKKFYIKTMLLHEITKDKNLNTKIYELFKHSPPWAGRVTDEEMEVTYDEVMNKNQGRAYVDLVYLQGELVAFNVMQYVLCYVEKENIVIHHAKIAVLSGKVSAPGLMPFVIYRHGFLPLANGSSTKVISVFESASVISYTHMTELDHYPRQDKLEKYIPLLRKTIYANMQERLIYDKEHQIWRIQDLLAYFIRYGKSPVWKTRRDIRIDNLFVENNYKQGESFLIMFEGEQKNCGKFYEQNKQCFDTPDRAAIMRFGPQVKF